MSEKNLSVYVVQVPTGDEELFQKRVSNKLVLHPELKDKIGKIEFPKNTYYRSRKTKSVEYETAAAPGYVLIQLEYCPEVFFFLKSTAGFIGFLPRPAVCADADADQFIPKPLTDEEYSKFMKTASEKDRDRVHKHGFQLNDRVQIKNGLWQSVTGRVIKVDNSKVTVEITILGKTISKEFQAYEMALV